MAVPLAVPVSDETTNIMLRHQPRMGHGPSRWQTNLRLSTRESCIIPLICVLLNSIPNTSSMASSPLGTLGLRIQTQLATYDIHAAENTLKKGFTAKVLLQKC